MKKILYIETTLSNQTALDRINTIDFAGLLIISFCFIFESVKVYIMFRTAKYNSMF